MMEVDSRWVPLTALCASFQLLTEKESAHCFFNFSVALPNPLDVIILVGVIPPLPIIAFCLAVLARHKNRYSGDDGIRTRDFRCDRPARTANSSTSPWPADGQGGAGSRGSLDQVTE